MRIKYVHCLNDECFTDGKPTEIKKKGYVHCCEACKNVTLKNNRAKPKKKRQTNICTHCRNCGIKLTTNQRGSGYVHCNSICRKQANGILMSWCHVCGTKFKPKKGRRDKYCSGLCFNDHIQVNKMPLATLKLKNKMRNGIRLSLKYGKDGRSWLSLVDYDVNQLIKRLKRTIPKGYKWQDFIDGRLHIDHIIPISVFNFTEPEHIDFKRCWALSNLQLLPIKENLMKHNKIERPFQPALLLKIN